MPSIQVRSNSGDRKRDETTVPSQALFMLNSPFVQRQALALAQTVLSKQHGDDDTRTREVYERVSADIPILGMSPGRRCSWPDTPPCG